MDSFLLLSSSFRLALRRLPPASELPAPPSLLLSPAMESIRKIRLHLIFDFFFVVDFLIFDLSMLFRNRK